MAQLWPLVLACSVCSWQMFPCNRHTLGFPRFSNWMEGVEREGAEKERKGEKKKREREGGRKEEREWFKSTVPWHMQINSVRSKGLWPPAICHFDEAQIWTVHVSGLFTARGRLLAGAGPEMTASILVLWTSWYGRSFVSWWKWPCGWEENFRECGNDHQLVGREWDRVLKTLWKACDSGQSQESVSSLPALAIQDSWRSQNQPLQTSVVCCALGHGGKDSNQSSNLRAYYMPGKVLRA